MRLHPVRPPLIKLEHKVWRFVSQNRARRFSYREAARLQGLQRDMIFPDSPAGSLDNRYTVIGNAVPPPLFEAVAKELPLIWD